MADAERYARSALSDPKLTGQDLCNSLFLTAEWQFQQKRYGEAIQTIEQLNKLRRHSMQWLLMAQCQKEVGNEAGVEQALLRAVHINPRLNNIHRQLAEMYRRRRTAGKAKYHERRAGP